MFLYFLALATLVLIYLSYRLVFSKKASTLSSGPVNSEKITERQSVQKGNQTPEKIEQKSGETKDFNNALYITPEEECDPEVLKNLLAKILKLPRMSTLVHRIYSLMQEPDCSPKEVANIAQSDPVLVSRILQTINSSYYALPNRVNNVFSAILLMGYNQLYRMILSLEMRKTFDSVEINPDWKKSIWLHSSYVSSVAGYLAKKYNIMPEGLASTAGLLHDIGKIYLCPFIKKEEDFLKLYDTHSVDLSLLENEASYFGLTHAIVGASLMKCWNFSSLLKHVAAYHHFPLFVPPSSFEDDKVKGVSLVCISDIISKAYSYEDESIMRDLPMDRDYFKILGLPDDLGAVLKDEQLLQRLRDAKKMVNSMS